MACVASSRLHWYCHRCKGRNRKDRSVWQLDVSSAHQSFIIGLLSSWPDSVISNTKVRHTKSRFTARRRVWFTSYLVVSTENLRRLSTDPSDGCLPTRAGQSLQLLLLVVVVAASRSLCADNTHRQSRWWLTVSRWRLGCFCRMEIAVVGGEYMAWSAGVGLGEDPILARELFSLNEWMAHPNFLFYNLSPSTMIAIYSGTLCSFRVPYLPRKWKAFHPSWWKAHLDG